MNTVLVIGTSGSVYPANMIPETAKQYGAKVIEINPEQSEFTRKGITNIFLRGSASAAMRVLWKAIQDCQK